jgi:hypothetical protein
MSKDHESWATNDGNHVMTATLCENGGTPKMMVRLKDTFVPPAIPCPTF